MTQNVLDMVFCVTGGKTMRKPYISSSNYILKMSNYNKGEWVNIWDSLYYDFLKKHKNQEIRDHQDKNGRTPLHLAATFDMAQTAAILLNLQADPSVMDKYGKWF